MNMPNRTDKRLYKKCIKCRIFKPREDIPADPDAGKEAVKRGFGAHNSSDGLQSICFACKNIMNTKSRERNVTARIRHHTATRCLTQLGVHAPSTFTKDMESYLGYRVSALVRALGKDLKSREGSHRKLKDALNEGYHIDHVRPLSSFPVISQTDDRLAEAFVDWDMFRECWSISNLSAIPSAENLAKGAKWADLGANLVIVDDMVDAPLTDEQKDKLKDWYGADELKGSPTVPHPDTIISVGIESDSDESD